MRLFAAKWTLGPLLLFQGGRVRRTALVLPEAPGAREGAVVEQTHEVGAAAGVVAAVPGQDLSDAFGECHEDLCVSALRGLEPSVPV